MIGRLGAVVGRGGSIAEKRVIVATLTAGVHHCAASIGVGFAARIAGVAEGAVGGQVVRGRTGDGSALQTIGEDALLAKGDCVDGQLVDLIVVAEAQALIRAACLRVRIETVRSRLASPAEQWQVIHDQSNPSLPLARPSL